MFSLKSRQDGFRLILPQDFICDEINEKYTKILKDQKSFYTRPIDFLNESIQKVEILGFDNGTIQQQQPGTGNPLRNPNRINENKFLHTASDYTYRSELNPLQLIDKTLNVTFKHTIGFLNYFILFENFWYQYSRDSSYSSVDFDFTIDLLDYNGRAYSRIVIINPFIHAIDMLSFDYSQPVAQSQTFRVIFKYSNIDYQFIDMDDE